MRSATREGSYEKYQICKSLYSAKNIGWLVYKRKNFCTEPAANIFFWRNFGEWVPLSGRTLKPASIMSRYGCKIIFGTFPVRQVVHITNNTDNSNWIRNPVCYMNCMSNKSKLFKPIISANSHIVHFDLNHSIDSDWENRSGEMSAWDLWRILWGRFLRSP